VGRVAVRVGGSCRGERDAPLAGGGCWRVVFCAAAATGAASCLLTLGLGCGVGLV
jgi:hypothetical protein